MKIHLKSKSNRNKYAIPPFSARQETLADCHSRIAHHRSQVTNHAAPIANHDSRPLPPACPEVRKALCRGHLPETKSKNHAHRVPDPFAGHAAPITNHASLRDVTLLHPFSNRQRLVKFNRQLFATSQNALFARHATLAQAAAAPHFQFAHSPRTTNLLRRQAVHYSPITDHQSLQCSLPYASLAPPFARGSGVFTPIRGRYLSTIGPFHLPFALATLCPQLFGHLGYL
jgi:hypothetical protein